MTEITRHGVGKRMSQAVLHNDTIYLAGQVGDPEQDVVQQTRSALHAIDDLLITLGSSKSRLLSCTIWLADMADFDAMNRVWDAWIDPENPPARATCEAKLADPAYRVEIIAVAAA